MAVLTLGCGDDGSSAASGSESSGAEAPPAHTPVLPSSALPEAIRFVNFGVTTPEQVKAQFTAENLYVTENMDESMGGSRELRVRARGPNEGIPFGTVNVTRRQSSGGYEGALGDNYGSVRFSFARINGQGDPVLYQVEIAQPPEESTSACAPGATLASAAGATEGCPEGSVYQPSAPDAEGHYFLCSGDEDGQQQMTLGCKTMAGSRMMTYTMVVPH